MDLILPEKIKAMIGTELFSIDEVGMSDSSVLLFEDKVLKIQTVCEESENEYNMMRWLYKILPVPKVLGFERRNGKSYLLMTRVSGEMSCSQQYMLDPEILVSLLSDALKMLWSVDINECPFMCDLDKKLQMARYNVEKNLVDMDNVQADTFGENGFENPRALLEWLDVNRPEEELVLSHGDFCLPNIFLNRDKIAGFIDLGKTGKADKWQDIALCYRSLRDNFGGKFTENKYGEFSAELLFEKLGIDPDWEKIRYYILLDELF